MAQESKSKIAIIGGGPAGCICAYYLKQQGFSPIIFEKNSPLKTLLPTGGGRCNLAHAEFDLKELASNYPRGEKFLYSVFSKFATAETIDFFEKIGVETYIQDDMRIFPTSNSASEVRKSILNAISGIKIQNECVSDVKLCNGGFSVKTEKASYFFEKVVVAIGGHSAFELARNFGHKIENPIPALTSLNINEDFSALSGVSIPNIAIKFDKRQERGDILFTHNGISGPLIYKISSVMARKGFPYTINLDFVGELDLQTTLNENPHKSIKNIISAYVPKSFTEFILKKANIDEDLKAHKINGNARDKILNLLNNFELTVLSSAKGGEVVTCGGVSLNEIDPKSMESKIVKNLYFCGEVLDIDGFCGGFNLQNCWSTGYIAAMGVMQ
ncbi:NAD(P)/FAD-dependent oxidoreductase [bacterium]|nr:NAD(P)/FAD-dependent oxidoreductase [bacterium]